MAEEGTVARCEMDSHADTCVAGPNFMILEFTGEQCDVTPYTSDYQPITNVAVVNAVTAFTDASTGVTVILRFNQVLWYGKRMKMSLINPNQLRHFGIAVSDDPTDKTRPFGIVTEYQEIPFQMDGTTVYFETRVPTAWELENCKTIEVTDESVWNPSNVTIANIATTSDLPLVEMLTRRTLSSLNVTNKDIPDDTCNDLTPYDDATLLNRMIGNVKVATAHRDANISFVGSKDRHSNVNAETVARKFRCGIETAQRTLKTTTQRGVRHSIHPLHRRYRVDHLNLHRRRLGDTFYMDTLFSRVKSLNGHTCAQLITNGSFTRTYPMESKASSNIAQALNEFVDDVGIPGTLICDLASEQTGKNTEVLKAIRRYQIRLLPAEKGRGTTQNHRAETEIREVKTKWKIRMRENQVPSRLWDYGLVYISEVQSLLARGLDQRPGIEKVMGQTVDISEWLDFDFYDRVWYWDKPKTDMTNEQARIGRWLGIAHRVGSDMTYWILTESGKVIARSTVQHITTSDIGTDAIRDRVSTFDATLLTHLSDENFHIDHPNPVFYLQDDVDVADPAVDDIPADAEYGDMNQPAKSDADDIEFDSFDQYLSSEFMVNQDGEAAIAKVVKRAKDNNGNPIGKRNANPLLDTREYECELEDGSVMRYNANIIAENIFAQCDDAGRRQAILDEIVDHKSDKRALRADNGYVTTKRGRRVPKNTTKGWQILCQWKDGSTDWVDLKYVKDSNPIELAEYAVANRIQEEPAFKWWVSETLRIRNRIIGKVKSRYWKTNHKYGIKLPHSVQEALQIDKETGTDFWWKAIQKEMKKVMIAFEYDESLTPDQIREGLAKGSYVGFQEIRCHMIFDVKMDLTRKARFVAGGHLTEPPSSITYSSVVSRDSVRLAFLLAALNGLDIMTCDIGNAYLNAPCREKVWFVAGPEFGSRQGTVVKVVRALYGLKSSGASWRAMFNNSILEMGFKPSIADPDVYLRAFAKPDGFKYYEYILVYVDDVLIISHAPEAHLKVIQANYELNPTSVGPPNRYLGADVEKVTRPGDPTGQEYWSFSANTYVRNAVKNVKILLQEEGRGLKSTAKTPFPSTTYRPEVDMTDECDADYASRYQNLIGVLRWAVELGRIDIYTEVALLSQHLALPRMGHLEAVYHVFAYLNKHEKSRIIFDPTDPVPVTPASHRPDWSSFYQQLEEELPPKMPEPLGNPVTVHVFVDANHAGNVVTRRSHTGILLFVQNSPIQWLSRRQNTVETSTFGSEFVALRNARDMIISMRYKLRMFGVPIDGPAQVYCDNQGVVKNTSIPESVLSKKHNAINYHAVREAAAAGVLQVHKEDTETNLADLFTKVLPADRRRQLLGSIVYNL
jgi:Reverse transcriptase (RNA-dependent DNA polymerase)